MYALGKNHHHSKYVNFFETLKLVCKSSTIFFNLSQSQPHSLSLSVAPFVRRLSFSFELHVDAACSFLPLSVRLTLFSVFGFFYCGEWRSKRREHAVNFEISVFRIKLGTESGACNVLGMCVSGECALHSRNRTFMQLILIVLALYMSITLCAVHFYLSSVCMLPISFSFVRSVGTVPSIV